MPRCPKDSTYKIGLYRKPVRSVAGGGTYLCHIERSGLVPKMREQSGSHFPLCPCGGGGALATELTLRRWSPQLLPVAGCHVMG